MSTAVSRLPAACNTTEASTPQTWAMRKQRSVLGWLDWAVPVRILLNADGVSPTECAKVRFEQPCWRTSDPTIAANIGIKWR